MVFTMYEKKSKIIKIIILSQYKKVATCKKKINIIKLTNKNTIKMRTQQEYKL